MSTRNGQAGVPFLRLPPFPGSRPVVGPAVWSVDDVDIAGLADALRAARVVGRFWGRQPAIAADCGLLLVPHSAAQARAMRRAARGAGRAEYAAQVGAKGGSIATVAEDCDPWHLMDAAGEVWAGAGNEIALIAALRGRKVTLFDGVQAAQELDEAGLRSELKAAIEASAMVDPYDGAATDAASVIAMLRRWRTLIDANRETRAVFGVARWKRKTVDPLLWDGQGPVRHMRTSRDALHAGGGAAIAWKARTPANLLAELVQRGVVPGEIEDGMIRSIGLGANCVPPLSIVVDRRGIYFDPSRPSDLEVILAEAEFAPGLAARAGRLRERLVSEGISKYAGGSHATRRAAGIVRSNASSLRRVLVTGQVEDDRSIQTGGGGMTNRALLERARRLEPHAQLIYRPHPDVEAGHRKGRVDDAEVLAWADAIDRETPIAALIEGVDALHVITSLAGFEALLRGRDVITHGMPFYAGWGLTSDMLPASPRRGRRLSLDELVAGTLILYPRYVDPVTLLPCTPERLIDRISSNLAKVSSPLIVMREWQGRLRRRFDALGSAR